MQGPDVTWMLADHAQVADGKLFISGGGWDTLTVGTPYAVAIMIKVPWDLANRPIPVLVSLLTEDGHPVELPEPFGRIQFEANLEVGRPPGLRHGTSLSAPLTLSVPPLPLSPDAAFYWQMSIDGQIQDSRLSFQTRADSLR